MYVVKSDLVRLCIYNMAVLICCIFVCLVVMLLWAFVDPALRIPRWGLQKMP